MKTLLTAAVCAAMLMGSTAMADHIWINEFHYDNPSTDVGEFVEVAIRNPNGSGFGPSDYALEFYNGSNGDLYNTSGTLDTFSTISPAFPIANSSSTVTLYSEMIAGIQNGAPDGIALVNVTNSTVAAFLSYEGSFTADADNGGIAGGLGLTSTDVGVAEPGAGNTTSLSASGTGIGADQFNAGSFILTETATPGTVNDGQRLDTIPEPASIVMMMLASCIAAAAGMRSRLG